MSKVRLCKDCLFEFGARPVNMQRPAPHPGPRCATHHRKERKRQRDARHDTYVQKTYGLEPGEYAKLKEFQGGVCWICQRAKGIAKKLPVDHDHKTGKPRGLLCGPCNEGVLGHLRDDPEALLRAVRYLLHPPYEQMRGAGDPSVFITVKSIEQPTRE